MIRTFRAAGLRKETVAVVDGEHEKPRDGEGRSFSFFLPTSGPKACLTVVGCGTLAAVLVVGIFIGGVRLFWGSLTADPETNEPAPESSPRETLAEDVLKMCDLIEGRGVLGASPGRRVDAGDNFSDSFDSHGFRIVHDDCEWNIASSEGEWRFVFSYDAFAAAPDGALMIDRAVEDFDEKRGEGVQWETDLESDVEGVGDEAYQAYGQDSSFDSRSQYALLVRSENAVFRIELQDMMDPALAIGETPTAEEYLNEARPAVSHIEGVFTRMLPDDAT